MTGVKPLVMLLPAVALAAAAGVYSVGHPQRALALGGVLLVGLILLDLNGRKGTLVERFAWIPWGWIALLLVTDIRLIDSDPLAVATGGVNVQHLIQIGAYAVVVILAMRARGAMLPLYPRPVPKGALLALPVVAVVSAVWSIVQVYTFVRALQLGVLAVLALVMVRIWASDPEAGEEIFKRSLRLFVQAVTILMVIGLATAPNLSDRFTWLGMHAGVAASYMGIAFVVLVLGGRSWTRFSTFTYWPRLLLFAFGLYLAQTRSVLGGVVLAIGVGLWFRGRQVPMSRYLGVVYYLLGGLLFALAATAHLSGYLTRGEPVQAIETLSGRIPLWQFAIGQLESVQEWAWGFGYGASRVILLSSPRFQWAGSAHSTWMEVLLGIGIVGVIATVATVLVLMALLVKRDLFTRSNVIALAILAFFLMTSPISEGLAIPGHGFGLLALIHLPALGQKARRSLRVSPEEAAVRTAAVR